LVRKNPKPVLSHSTMFRDELHCSMAKQKSFHLITSSALNSTDCGIVRPICFSFQIND
jgi:hypothetical protein